MIARIWHGYTKPEHDDAYESMLKPELLPGISKVQGYKGSYLLRRRAGNEIEFITIMLWDSIEAIRAVAGAERYGALPDRPCRARASHDCDSTEVLDVSTYHGAWAHPQRKGSDARQCRIVRGYAARLDIVSMVSSFVRRFILKLLLLGAWADKVQPSHQWEAASS